MYVCRCVCMYMYVCSGLRECLMYVCMYVCMYACMYVAVVREYTMCVCMYVGM